MKVLQRGAGKAEGPTLMPVCCSWTAKLSDGSGIIKGLPRTKLEKWLCRKRRKEKAGKIIVVEYLHTDWNKN